MLTYAKRAKTEKNPHGGGEKGVVGRPRILTKEIVQAMKKARRDGITTREMEEIFGFHRCTISQILSGRYARMGYMPSSWLGAPARSPTKVAPRGGRS